MGAGEWGSLLLLSLLWGGAFFFSKIALDELRPFSVALVRVTIGAAALWCVLLVTGQRMPASPRLWGQFALMGLINNLIPFSLIFWGQTQIASGLAAILNATTPLWTVLLAHWLTQDDRLTSQRIAGVLIGLAGVAVMVGGAAMGGLGLNLLAQLAVIGAALSYAFAVIFGRRFRGLPPLVPAVGQLTCSTLMLLPLVALLDGPPAALPGTTTLLALLGLGLLSTALAYNLYFRLLATAGATNVAMVTLLIPVSAVLLGTLFLGEQIEPRHYAGMALIALGLLAIDGRLLRALSLLLTTDDGRPTTGGPV